LKLCYKCHAAEHGRSGSQALTAAI
jgi:hypothetical protein